MIKVGSKGHPSTSSLWRGTAPAARGRTPRRGPSTGPLRLLSGPCTRHISAAFPGNAEFRNRRDQNVTQSPRLVLRRSAAFHTCFPGPTPTSPHRNMSAPQTRQGPFLRPAGRPVNPSLSSEQRHCCGLGAASRCPWGRLCQGGPAGTGFLCSRPGPAPARGRARLGGFQSQDAGVGIPK